MTRAASPRVVVSGLGVVSPYGAGVKSLWTGLSAGACAIRPVTAIETEGLRSRVAAEVPAEVLVGLGASRRRSRADRLALAAAAEAMADAGLERTGSAPGGLPRRGGGRRHARGRGVVLG